jgi:hypothetical protein
MITWGSATTISGDTDVDTKGTLVAAFNLGAGPGVPPAPSPINGVTFVGLAFPIGTISPVSDPSGHFTFAINPPLVAEWSSSNGQTSVNPPFANLSASYQALLSSFTGYTDVEGIGFNLTMSGLTAGHTYEFEWWSNDTTDRFGRPTTATAGNSVTLNPNTTGVGGGVGQFAVGTFTADGSEVITFTQGLSATSDVNGFELRDITPTATGVPEPASLTLLGIGALCSLGYGWRKRKQAQP